MTFFCKNKITPIKFLTNQKKIEKKSIRINLPEEKQNIKFLKKLQASCLKFMEKEKVKINDYEKRNQENFMNDCNRFTEYIRLVNISNHYPNIMKNTKIIDLNENICSSGENVINQKILNLLYKDNSSNNLAVRCNNYINIESEFTYLTMSLKNFHIVEKLVLQFPFVLKFGDYCMSSIHDIKKSEHVSEIPLISLMTQYTNISLKVYGIKNFEKKILNYLSKDWLQIPTYRNIFIILIVEMHTPKVLVEDI